jgi:hypothetical protein
LGDVFEVTGAVSVGGWQVEGAAEAVLPVEEVLDVREREFDGLFAFARHGANVNTLKYTQVCDSGSEDEVGAVNLETVFGDGAGNHVEGAKEDVEGLGVGESAEAVKEDLGDVFGDRDVPGLGGDSDGGGEHDRKDGEMRGEGAGGGDGDGVQRAAVDEFKVAEAFGGEDAGDGDGGEDGVYKGAAGEEDFASAVEVGGGEGAGDFEVVEGAVANRLFEPFGRASQSEEGGGFAFAVSVEAFLVEGGEEIFDLVGGVAEGEEDGDEAAEGGSGKGLDFVSFVLEATDDADMGVAFGASAAEGESEVHLVGDLRLAQGKFTIEDIDFFKFQASSRGNGS